MKTRSEMPRRHSTAENGFVLVAVMFMLAILVLSLAVAAPRIRQQLQRDRELEATHRGKQYIRAIQLYYRKFHAYPPNMDALVKTNEVRFLRKKYTDPITSKDDWAPIHFGENKVPTVMGFFGVPLTTSSIAGTGPGGIGSGNQAISSSAISNENPVPGGNSSNSSNGSSDSSTGGQTFGGAGIIGFSIPSERRSLLVYKKQDHFNQWEFVYDPIVDSGINLRGAGAGIGAAPGTPGSSNGNPLNPGGSGPGSPGPPSGYQPPPGAPPMQPPCGGTWSPNGTLPVPCPQ
jgi:type II secretory pathway pseudopilin PulG